MTGRAEALRYYGLARANCCSAGLQACHKLDVMKKDVAPLQHVQYLWKDAEADRLKGVDRLVYRSNKLGEDLTLTNTGGGNTSSKLMERIR